MRTWAVILACVVIFGPERFPLGAGMHTEIRVQLCTHTGWNNGETVVSVETRTYERTQNQDGSYTTMMLSHGEDGWTAASTTHLDITIRGEGKP